jgi:Acetyltransferase (isoleucine patch superfamily)
MIRIFHKATNILSNVNLTKFVYYNFFCKSVVRKKGCYLITFRNCVINLHKSSRLYINIGTIQLGVAKLRGSKAETYLQMDENASWVSNGAAELFFQTQIHIQKNAVFETGYFSANIGTAIICSKKVTLGENVMIGRNILIYDSDHHRIIDQNGDMVNNDKEVTIRDHVWLTSNVTVLRGVTIGEGCIVAAQTVIKKDLPPDSLVFGSTSANVTIVKKETAWSRESTH